MIRAWRELVGSDPVDLADGTSTSGATVSYLRNRGTTPLYVGEGLVLEPGESLPGAELGATDHLIVSRRGPDSSEDVAAEPVDIMLSWG